MSGVYLVVQDARPGARVDLVLQPTAGGWPHLTVFYGGYVVKDKRSKLVSCAQEIAKPWLLTPTTVKLTHAKVNSFEKSPGVMRHDVLLMTDQKSTRAVAVSRTLIKKHFAAKDIGKFSMHVPHVTVGTLDDQELAEKMASYINDKELPMQVIVTGVTID